MKSNLLRRRGDYFHRLSLCFIFSAILGGILINLPGAIEAIRDLFGV